MSLVQVQRQGGVRLLRLDDPERRNILTPAMCEALSTAVRAAEADEEAKALIITGAPPAFCAGANLDDLKAAGEGRTEAVKAVYRSFLDVADCRLPTIAAINGAAVGAGLNLALACDIRLASDQASFDTRFLKIGIHPGGGHSWLLLRAVGWSEACRMLLLGHPVGPREALQAGLVQRVVEADELIEAAIDVASATDALPRELLLATKATLRMAAASDHHAMLEHETRSQLHSLGRAPFQDLIARLEARMGRS